MNSNNPKRHHYIPKMLLNNFLDDKDRIWIYDKNGGKLYQGTPTNTFVQRNLYRTLNFDHENYSCEAEEELSRIESRAAPVIRRIIKCARNNEHPKLSPEDRDAWKRFALAMARRTPESQERVFSGRNRDTFYEAAKTRADELNYDLPDKEILYQDIRILKLKKLVESSINARFAAGAHPYEQDRTERFCHEAGLCVTVICIPKRSFVIGSHGFAIVRRNHQNDPAQGSWLPIAHDVAVAPTAFPDEEFLFQLDHDSDRIIRRINRAAVAQSRIIAGRSKALICSLMQGQQETR